MTGRRDVYRHSDGRSAGDGEHPDWLTDRLEWFQDLKLGVFFHWGPYCQWDCCESWPLVPEDEWARPDTLRCWNDRGRDLERFQRDYRALNETFDPTDFDPTVWAAASKDAGFKYVNFTTKHHDGFCMWDTRTTDYRVTHPSCPHHRHPRADIVRHVFDAFRSEGLAVSCYFSKSDWHSPYYWDPRLPALTRNPNYDTSEHPGLWKGFVDYVHAQIGELMSGYGPIDILWLDGGQVRPPKQDIDMPRLAASARRLQPGLIVVDRTVGGEFENVITPEHQIPDAPLEQAWESCLCMGQSWKYVSDHEVFKPLPELLRLIIETVSKGGNLLLGHGPTPDGKLQRGALERMRELGAWLRANGASVYGTRAIPPYGEGEAVRFTAGKDGTVYAFIYPAPATENGAKETFIRSFTPVERSPVIRLDNGKRLRWRKEDTGFSVETGDGGGLPVVIGFEPVKF